MSEKVIGLIYRYGRNDYQINLMDFGPLDQEYLMRILEAYDYSCTSIRGDRMLNIGSADIDYFEDKWAKEDAEAKRKELAHELYDLGFGKTDALYDHSADKQMTEEDMIESLSTHNGAAYLLETFLQFCDGSQEDKDHDMFFKASMDIVHYMEDLT